MEVVYIDPTVAEGSEDDEQLTERGAIAGEVTKNSKATFNIFKIDEEIKSDKNLPGETPQFPQPRKSTDMKKVFNMRHSSANLEPEITEYEESKK